MIFELCLNNMMSYFEKVFLYIVGINNQPGYLLPLNKPPASSAYFSAMERPVGAV